MFAAEAQECERSKSSKTKLDAWETVREALPESSYQNMAQLAYVDVPKSDTQAWLFWIQADKQVRSTPVHLDAIACTLHACLQRTHDQARLLLALTHISQH